MQWTGSASAPVRNCFGPGSARAKQAGDWEQHAHNATTKCKNQFQSLESTPFHAFPDARALQRTRPRTSNQPACNFALFTLLLEDDFQSETANFARLQLPSTYNFPNKWEGG